MLTQLKPSFPHRHNADGSHDSICKVCFATVATVLNELELAGFETAHVCQPADLYRLSQSQWARPRIPLEPTREGQRCHSKHVRCRH
jgi:hypothetical protein